MKENGFTLKKKRYPAETQSDADYVDDLTFLGKISERAESLFHSLQKVGGGIVLYVNANETEYMYFKQKGAISNLREKKTLNFLFPYLESNILSSKSDVGVECY